MQPLDALSYVLSGVALCVCLGWAFILARVWQTIEELERLPTRGGTAVSNARVSVVLAARNEEQVIARAVRSLLLQENVDLQVIVVDDGSDDDTPRILNDVAAQDRRLLVLRNDKVPPGWVAKCYALELGQGRADGDYILFTDADVVHGRHALWHAVSVMERDGLDHLAVHPRFEASAIVEAIVLPLFYLLYEFRFMDRRALVADSGTGAGIGAFNLVRAESYRLRGTHARIRGAVLDDVALGRMMRIEGGRGRVMRAVSQVRMRPYRSLRDLYEGIRKGALSGSGYSAIGTAVSALALGFAAVAPIPLFLAGGTIAWAGHLPWPMLPAVGALALPIVGLLKARTLVKFEPLSALLFPLGALMIAVASLHAALTFAVFGTVQWRGRTYHRRDLRDAFGA